MTLHAFMETWLKVTLAIVTTTFQICQENAQSGNDMEKKIFQSG